MNTGTCTYSINLVGGILTKNVVKQTTMYRVLRLNKHSSCDDSSRAHSKSGRAGSDRFKRGCFKPVIGFGGVGGGGGGGAFTGAGQVTERSVRAATANCVGDTLRWARQHCRHGLEGTN